jgi:hypothetical protein
MKIYKIFIKYLKKKSKKSLKFQILFKTFIKNKYFEKNYFIKLG